MENPGAILDVLADADCLLIGAHALQAYGVSRQTADIDIMIAEPETEEIERLLNAQGYRCDGRTRNFSRYHHFSPDHLDVDVLFLDPPTYASLSVESRTFRIGGANLRVPSLPHLVALKLHAIRNEPRREAKDLGDILRLLQANPDAVSENALRDLCDRYGSPQIHQKIISQQ